MSKILCTKMHITDMYISIQTNWKEHWTASLYENETIRVDKIMLLANKFTAQSRSRIRSQLLDMLDRFANFLDIEPSQEICCGCTKT